MVSMSFASTPSLAAKSFGFTMLSASMRLHASMRSPLLSSGPAGLLALATGDPCLTVRFIQMIEDVVGFRQHDVSILEDRNIVLARDFMDHFAHRAKVGYDDVFVFDVEVRQ